jgi:hypothetical protein
LQRLGEVAPALSMAWAGQGAWWILLGLVTVWGIVLLGRREDVDDAAAASGGWSFRLEVVVMGAFGLALLVPPALPRLGIDDAPARLMVVAVVLGTLLPHGPIVGRRRLIFIPLVLLAALFPWRLAQAFGRAQQRLVRPVRLSARIPRGASTLTLVLESQPDPALDPRFHLADGVHAWPQVFAGGFDAYGPDGFPVTPRAEARLPAPPRDQPRQLHPEDAARWDYLLVQGYPGNLLEGDPSHPFEPVAVDGPWRLYRSVK